MTFFTDTQLVKQIHDEPDLRNIWNGLTREAKEQVLKELDHDNWHLDQIVYEATEQILEAK